MFKMLLDQMISHPFAKKRSSFEDDKAQLLKLCGQTSVLKFSDAYDFSNYEIKQLQEGSFAEIYILTSVKTKENIRSVLKIIPVADETDEDDDNQTLKHVLAEVKISMSLSMLRNNKYNQTTNFMKLNQVITVSGKFPKELLSAGYGFNIGLLSFNTRSTEFPDDQLFVILDIEHAGYSLKDFKFQNALEAESVLKQIIATLAVAEEQFSFEHRDLHLGNVLLQRNKSKHISFKINGCDITFASHGIHVTIIDFTFSRLYENGSIYYNDLTLDGSIFSGSMLHHYIYRTMKMKIGNQWESYLPYTNILWLKFLSARLKEYEYCRPFTKLHRKGLNGMDKLENKLNSCNSASDCMKLCENFTENFETDPERCARSSKTSHVLPSSTENSVKDN